MKPRDQNYPDMPRLKRGAKVWIVTITRYGTFPYGLTARAAVIRKPDVSGLPIWYKVYVPQWKSWGHWSVYGATWRNLFPTRASARYQAKLYNLILRCDDDGNFDGLDAQMPWLYALDVAIRDMRKKGARRGT